MEDVKKRGTSQSPLHHHKSLKNYGRGEMWEFLSLLGFLEDKTHAEKSLHGVDRVVDRS